LHVIPSHLAVKESAAYAVPYSIHDWVYDSDINPFSRCDTEPVRVRLGHSVGDYRPHAFVQAESDFNDCTDAHWYDQPII
jgi:hypothetical protein